MRKRILMFLLSSLMTIGLSTEVLADTGIKSYKCFNIDYDHMENKKRVVYLIEDLEWMTVNEIVSNDKEVSLFGVEIKGSHLEPGQKKYYFPTNSPEGFSIEAYEGIEVNLSWEKSTSVEVGLEGGTSVVRYGTGAVIRLIPYTSGKHRLFIKNLGNVAIDVSGTIEL